MSLLRGGDERVGALAVPQRGELGVRGVALFLVGLPAAQDLLVVLVLVVGFEARSAVGLGVVPQGLRERPRAGQEPLLHQHRHDAARLAAPVAPRALGEDLVQQRELLASRPSAGVKARVLSSRVLEVLHVRQVRLEPTDRDVAQRALVQVGAPLEPAAVDHLHQRGERLGVAVVRGGGQEQPVLALLRERPGGDRPLAVDRVAAEPGGGGRARGRDVVRLVHDEHVERVPARGSSCPARRRTRRAAAAGRAATAATPSTRSPAGRAGTGWRSARGCAAPSPSARC